MEAEISRGCLEIEIVRHELRVEDCFKIRVVIATALNSVPILPPRIVPFIDADVLRGTDSDGRSNPGIVSRRSPAE
jgi:hypothetical protein